MGIREDRGNELRKDNIQDFRLLSPMQEGMLYHAQREPATPAYIEQTCWRISGPLDVGRLEKVWNLLIVRHDALRSVFIAAKAEHPLQVVLKERRITIHREDLRHLNPADQAARLDGYRQADRIAPFDLRRGPLLRVALFQTGEQIVHMVWTHHHIILDGWSSAILMEELLALYRAGGTDSLAAPAPPERYCEWLERQDLAQSRAWWASLLEGYEEASPLPADPLACGAGNLQVLKIEIDSTTTARLRDCAVTSGVTLNTVTQAAWGIVVARACHRGDVVFGMTVSGRPASLPGSERMVGLFINTVPVRVRFEETDSVAALLGKVQDQILKGVPFHYLPLAEIQDLSQPRSRLVDHLLTFENYPVGDALHEENGVLEAGLTIHHEGSHERTNYPLSVSILPGDRLTYTIRYIDSVYSPAQMERFADALRSLLESLRPEMAIRDLTLVSEKARIELNSFQGQKVIVPEEKTITELFEQQVREHPERLALVSEEGELTYRQLQARVTALARSIARAVDLQPEEPVALCLKPGAGVIIGILAILRAGGAYVPIDPSAPASHRDRVFAQTGVRIAIAVADFAAPEGIAVIVPQAGVDGSDDGSDNIPDRGWRATSSSLAYVLFTSGSTGEPKGVAIEQRSIINLVHTGIGAIWKPLGTELRVALIAPPVFDASGQQIFGALLLGHTLAVPSAEVKRDASLLLNWLERNRIDVCDGTPSRFSVLLDTGLCDRPRMPVRNWMLGGEALPTNMLRQYWAATHRRDVSVANLYGPTECCVDVSFDLLSAERLDSMPTAPVGKPFGNVQVLVLDENLEQLPVLFEGEICVAGPAVGRGYWGDEALTRRKFVAHPLAPASRLYRTGDMGRWLPDGRLEWRGRRDEQVKLRGYRIELGEIEQALRSHPLVEQAAANLIPAGAGRELAAWFTERAAVAPEQLRNWVRTLLPEYMTPAFFIRVDALPFTASGKLDRKRLTAPEMTHSIMERAANPTEAAVRAIWEDILGRSPIGLGQDFFAAGGHSLKAMQLVTRLRRDLGVAIGLDDFFAAPTVEGMSALLATRDAQRFLHIEPLSPAADYATSHAQRRLWFLNQIEGASAYNMPAAIALAGGLDSRALHAAFDEVIARHEILRTRLVMRDGELRQRVFPEDTADFREMDLRDEGDPNAEALRLLIAESSATFDLATDSPVRIRLFRIAKTEWVLFVNLHHAAGDAFSTSVLVRDLLAAYSSRNKLPPLRIQYRDYAAWWNQTMASNAAEGHRRHWHGKLSGEIPALNLPADRPRPAQPSFRGGKFRFAISRASVTASRDLAGREKTTFFAALVAAVKVLLHRYTGEEDILVGTAVAGRPHIELETQIGCYINTLVLRDTVRGAESFVDLLRSVGDTVKEALAHSIYPFDLLVSELPLPRDTSRNPLFDVMVILQPPLAAVPLLPGLSAKSLVFDRGVSKFDLTFDFAEQADGSLECTLEYSSDLFDRSRVQRLATHFTCVFEAAVRTPAIPIGKLPVLSAEETTHLAAGLSGASMVEPREGCPTVSSILERHATETPGSAAVRFRERYISWADLDRLTASLAHTILESGLRPGEVVGMHLSRSEGLAVAELAILRAGAIFLPFAETMPAERARFIAADSGMRALVSDNPPGWAAGLPVIDPCAVSPDRSRLPITRSVRRPEDAAYLIYTSGSTGTPKGVVIPHRALLSFAEKLQTNFGFRAGEILYASTPVTFDISILELICAPLNRITVHVASAEALEDPLCMSREIEHSRADLLQFTPSRLAQLLLAAGGDFLDRARVVLVGGEAFPSQLARKLKDFPRVQVWNVYGPTETCIWSTAELLSGGAARPLIGRPLADESVYILSPDLELQPLGVPGEIAIGGPGLALGYQNDDELTKRRFVESRFSPGKRLYLTGDLGRWTETGRLEYLGRKDRQVKVRGYRIEPGEIEHHLRSHPAVTAAAVVVREGELVSYVAAHSGEIIGELREHLRRRLPEYMIPVQFVILDGLPLTPNGKVDYRALPDPDPAAARKGWEAPLNALEWRVADIFEEVLGRRPVSRNDNFFDLGGESLKAMQALSRLRHDVASGLSLADLFVGPTVAELAALAASRSKAMLPPIVCTKETEGGYPLSHVQRRLWVLEQMAPDAAAYNMPSAFLLEGPVDVGALESAVQLLVKRHEILRSVFVLDAGEPRQFVHEAQACLQTVDLRAAPDRESRVALLLAAAAREPFDLACGPLFRCTAYLLDDHRAVLSFEMHHIVADGWSMRVLLRDLLALYCDGLPPLEVQYRDWAAWQNALLADGSLDQQREYWHGKLAGPIPVLDLPEDFARPAVQTFRGGDHRFALDPPLADGLRGIARESGASLFMILVTTVKVLLHRYTGKQDIIVGTAVAGREHLATESLAGPFINSVALRDTVQGGMNFLDLLANVRTTIICALENQAYPFDLLVDELIRDRDTSHSAFFDVMVSNGAEDHLDLSSAGLTARAIPTASGTIKVDLSFDFTETADGGIETVIEYNRDLFLPGRVARMQGHIETLIRSITRNCNQTIDAMDVLPVEERNTVVREFNRAEVEIDRNATVTDLFEERARLRPNALATACEGRCWTYRELDARANSIASRMIASRNIRPGDFVGVYTRRSDWMLASVLAIGKAGAAYIPIDPDYPAERVALLLGSSGCRMVLAEPDTACLRCGIEVWNVAGMAGDERAPAPPRRHGPRDLAYVIFTSGSTGTPKGVMVEHLSLANLVSHHLRELQLNSEDRSSVFASMAFDSSIAEYWPLLCAGGAVHFPSQDTRESPHALVQWIRDAGLTIVNVPTSLGEIILRGELPPKLAMRAFVLGGEKLRPLPRREFSFRIVNSYGPTEATVDAAWAWLDEDSYSSGNPPIGRPIQNARLYVLDGHLNPVPIGIPGELYIGGTVVARGYLNEPELTAQKFLFDPFASDGSRMYATGDRVRWREDGQLEYLGRTDWQVKVRGYRIEPGEIEARLLEHPAIAAAAAGTVQVGDTNELAAWIVFRKGVPRPDTPAIREFVSRSLPDFTTPSLLVPLDCLPMTPNGKINRGALPAPELEAESGFHPVAPRNPLETVIHGAWKAILGRSDFGVTGNFFDFGGHSLKAMQLTVRLLDALHVEILLREIFLAPTVAEQAVLAATKQRTQSRRIDPAPSLPDYPLSYAQRRLWLTALMEGPSARYNMPGAYVIEGQIDEPALARAVGTILERHEVLRTRFVVRDGEPRQVVDTLTPDDVELPRIDLGGEPDPDTCARELAEADLCRPFDLGHDRLIRCRLLRLGGARHVLLFTLHHIAGDGWSAQVLYEELRELYSAYASRREPSLPALRVQYKDYAWWEQQRGFAVEEAYWLKKMHSLPEPLPLPFDFPEADVRDFAGASTGLVLSAEVSRDLRRVATERQTTLSNLILAIFLVFLNRLTEKEDLALAMSVANRPHRDLETMAGFFVNAVILRVSIDERKRFEEVLAEVTAEVADALEHQRYPLDLLIERLNPPRRENRQPLFNVVYAFQSFTDITVRSSDAMGANPLPGGEWLFPSRTAKFDLTLFVVDHAGPARDSIHLSFEYSTELLTAATTRHWIETLGRFCEAVTEGETKASAA